MLSPHKVVNILRGTANTLEGIMEILNTYIIIGIGFVDEFQDIFFVLVVEFGKSKGGDVCFLVCCGSWKGKRELVFILDMQDFVDIEFLKAVLILQYVLFIS